MFKNYRIFFLPVLLLLFLSIILSSCKTFDGYCFSLDDARKHERAYNDYDYLFTKTTDEVVIDFIIKNNTLHIVDISVKNRFSRSIYRVYSITSFSIEEAIACFNRKGGYDWSNISNLSLCPVSWCIVPESFNNNTFPAFVFTYKGKAYCLCYDL